MYKRQQNHNAKNVRNETLKGIILVGILIFSIYIIRVINEEEATKTPLEYPSEFIEEGSITDQDLQNNFDILSEKIQELKSEPPYIFNWPLPKGFGTVPKQIRLNPLRILFLREITAFMNLVKHLKFY